MITQSLEDICDVKYVCFVHYLIEIINDTYRMNGKYFHYAGITVDCNLLVISTHL